LIRPELSQKIFWDKVSGQIKHHQDTMKTCVNSFGFGRNRHKMACERYKRYQAGLAGLWSSLGIMGIMGIMGTMGTMRTIGTI
jgi:hypothetical protein